MKNKSVVLSVLIIGLAIFAAAVWYQTRPAPVAQVEPVQPEIAEALIRSYSPILGPEEAPVTIVEFFDYNCPYCKRVKPEVQALMASDPNIRLVYREWPILGDGSMFAARAALASRKQGKYEEFHWAMMGLQGRAEEASVMKVATDIGLDLDQLRADMDAPEIDEHIQTSIDLTATLGCSGTPSFVIGDALVAGFAETSELEQHVAVAREAIE